MKEEPIQIPVPDKALDSLANTVVNRFNAAVRHRSSERCGAYSLSETLQNCYNQRNGILSCIDQEIVKDLGVDVHVNLSELKISTVVALLREFLLNTPELPFIVSPTEIPELTAVGKETVLNKIKRELFAKTTEFTGDLLALTRELKSKTLAEEQEYAQRACDKMMQLMKDQTQEGGFRTAMLGFIEDFATYPYAVLHGPVPTMKMQPVWQGETLVHKPRLCYEFRHVSVWDFFWSPDSSNAQDGTGVFIRERMSKQQLLMCAEMNSYIKENVHTVIEDVIKGTTPLNWSSANPDATKTPDMNSSAFGEGSVVEVIRHYGKLSGRELAEYGITGLDAFSFYEAMVTVVGRVTIQAYISPLQELGIRPVHTASFESTGTKIPGIGICQKIRDVERMYLAALRYLIRNADYASGPIAEVDPTRVADVVDMDDLDVTPRKLLLVKPMMAGGNVYKFTDIPANTGVFMQLANYCMDLADRITSIPASMHGEPTGTGANRTFRGIVNMQSNSLRVIQSAISNMDSCVFEPMGTLLYSMNMKYAKDPEIKGDAKVVAQGASGLMKKEMSKQNAIELLQVVAQVGVAAQGTIPPEVIKYAVMNVVKSLGLPDDVVNAPQESAPAMGGQMIAQEGVPQGAPIPQQLQAGM